MIAMLALLACSDPGRSPDPPAGPVLFTDTSAPEDTGEPAPLLGVVVVANETAVGITAFTAIWEGGALSFFLASGLPFAEPGDVEDFQVPTGMVRMDVRGADDTCAWIEAFIVEGEPHTWTVSAEQMTGVWQPDRYYCGY